MNMAGEVAKDGEADVDQQVGAAAGDEEDGDGWDWEVVSFGLEGRRVVRYAGTESAGQDSAGLRKR